MPARAWRRDDGRGAGGLGARTPADPGRPGSHRGAPWLSRNLPGVVDASSTTGAFDAVARVAVRDERELQRILVATRDAPGLARLCLCRSQPG
ncbi:MAG: Lrp/AsnC ligand binding domain-containing protein [Mycobacteriales bacterium]